MIGSTWAALILLLGSNVLSSRKTQAQKAAALSMSILLERKKTGRGVDPGTIIAIVSLVQDAFLVWHLQVGVDDTLEVDRGRPMIHNPWSCQRLLLNRVAQTKSTDANRPQINVTPNKAL